MSLGDLARSGISTEFLMEVMKGQIPKHQIVNKFGSNSAIGTAWEPVTSAALYQTPSTLTSLEIVSTDNTNDKAGGTGALVITIEGIGTDWGIVTEDIILNGTTAVAAVNQYFRIYRMYVKTSGVYASAAAPSHNSTITLRAAGAGATWGIINTDNSFGLSQSEVGAYSLPANMTAYLIDLHLDVETSKIVDVVAFTREAADTVASPFSPMKAFFIKRSIEGEHHVGTIPLRKIVGPADVGFMARATTSSKVEVEFTLLCVETS